MLRSSSRSLLDFTRLLLVGASTTLVAFSAQADGPKTAVLTLRLSLRNTHGQVGCLLFGSQQGFPKDPRAALQRKWCPVENSGSVCAFDPIPAGTYAAACFHDENGNGKLDTGLFGIPTEGTVASNNAKGFMGPPSFERARFWFAAAPTELHLRMNY